ncbi:hypothetical protein DC28_09175 [Spirochaeta lutea]|uniref:Uncharacterized protein n=2 Tax=Spirochaeta lutea TaxID=1480694 RepID=A0A098QWL9_9SPIO|nr:hypothetical protein DC28_09175 [Spirochaeta lutea]
MTFLVKYLLEQNAQVWAPPGQPEAQIIPPKGTEEAFHPLAQIPRTPLAARALMLDFKNNQRTLDYHLHIYNPAVQGKSLGEISATVIDQNIDTSIKGLVFPLRESLTYMLAQESGSVALVILGGMNTIFPPLQSIGYGAVQEVGRSLFSLYQNEGIAVRGFQAPADVDYGLYLDYISSVLRENTGKTRGRWNKFSGKTGLFGLR